uniref:RRM domain-containing protein n=1 Tax=Bionectria ochroleuca TaxID=29856 RepID=A0A8H7K220_BIOOC
MWTARSSRATPKFNLGLVPYQAQNGAQDPFYDPGAANTFAAHKMASPLALQEQQAFDYRSDKLKALTSTPSGYPSFSTAMAPEFFPFVEGSKQHKTVNHGVVKIRNIPFDTKRAEVIAFLGRNSKILNDSDEPVHIIMERVTSKTMDAYVEFCTLEDAMKAVERHHLNIMNGRVSRLGDRPVDVELSDQGCLMKDLFPLAVGIFWDGSRPEFKAQKPDQPWENFKGFISEEEMTMLVKHVEVPHRSPFSKDCPQRPYECLISTLKKFPWSYTDHITISQRRAVFKATCELLRLLARSIYKTDNHLHLNRQLYRRVASAAMGCHGFTPLMKDDIAAWFAQMSDEEQQLGYGQPPYAFGWRHQYAMCLKPGMPPDVVEWYIALIRDQTLRDTMSRPLQDRNDIQERTRDTDPYWGHFWAELGHVMGPAFDSLTIAQVAHMEFSAVERVLSRALACH